MNLNIYKMNYPSIKFHFLLPYGSKEFLMQMTDADRFHLLKKIIKTGASHDAWNAVIELFATWPDNKEKDKAFELANEEMEPWSDDLRHISSSWGALYHNRALLPVAGMAKSISIRKREQNGNQELIKIVQSPYIKNLRSLVVERSEIYIEGITALVTSPYLLQLESLALQGLSLSDKEINMILHATNLPSLTVLAINGMSLNDQRIKWLLDAPLVKQLTKLDISYNDIDDKKVLPISETENLHNLRYLNLSGNNLRNKGIRQITESKKLTSLQEMNLLNNKIDEETKSWITHFSRFRIIS